MSSAEKQTSPEVMSPTLDDSWASLYKLGGISAVLSVIFSLVWAVTPMYLNSLPYNGTGFEYFLTFVWQQSTAYNLWYSGEFLTVVFAVPLVLALYFVLRRVDKGVALIGASTSILGGLVYLSNVGTHFDLVQDAVTYNGGCTVCAQQAVTGAIASNSASSSDSIAGYLVLAGVLILSLMMFKSRVTGKVPGSLGLVFAAYSVLSAAVFAPGSSTLYYDLSQLPVVFFGVWALASGVKVYGAGSSKAHPQ